MIIALTLLNRPRGFKPENVELNIASRRDLKVDGCPSIENLFAQSALLMNATYIAFP